LAAVLKRLPALRCGLNVACNATVSHLLRQDSADIVDEFDKEISKAAGTAIDASVEGLLKDHIEADKNLKLLQRSLIEMASEKSILIFVDELDRCRQNFAVNVQFVLVTITQQFKAAINHTYGGDVDAQRYLDKFLIFEETLNFKLLYYIILN
jgi:predicted KAP-like P-loop ATPase